MQVSSEGTETGTTTVKVMGVGTNTWRRLRSLSAMRQQRIGEVLDQALRDYLDRQGVPSDFGGADDELGGLP
jgi:hypothetical protein